jgi:periplasmic protein TonB
MERNFALPITMAVMLHAGFLLGFHRSIDSGHTSLPDLRSATRDLIPFDLATETNSAPDSSAPGKGSTDVEKPATGELPPPVHLPEFTIGLTPTASRLSTNPVTGIDLRSLGSESGSEHGSGAGDIIRRDQLDNSPRARVQISPPYPAEAKQRDLVGEVLVEFVVDESGAVLAPRIVRSTDHVFDEATLRVIVRWRFEPGRRDGRVVRFRMAVPVVFKLGTD